MSIFQKASKKQSKLRSALFGPSGSGKTFTALSVAKGIGGNVAVIDTERGSASKYSDRFDFDVCELSKKTIDGYCAAIASAKGYSVLIIDSLSHGWQELLEHVEKLAQAKYRGNTWSAWSEGTPEQRRLIDAILDFDGHIIATMRSKTEWTTAKQDNGKSAPVRVGLAPEQGKGIEYEFDLLLELTVDHVCNVLKDRTGKFQDALIDKPGEAFGKSLVDWLSEGEAIPAKPAPPAQLTPEQELSKRRLGRMKAALAEKPDGIAEDVWLKVYCEAACEVCGFETIGSADFDSFSIEDLKKCSAYHTAIMAKVKTQC